MAENVKVIPSYWEEEKFEDDGNYEIATKPKLGSPTMPKPDGIKIETTKAIE